MLENLTNQFNIVNNDIKLVKEYLLTKINNLKKDLKTKSDYEKNYDKNSNLNKSINSHNLSPNLYFECDTMQKNIQSYEKLFNHSFWDWIEKHINNLIEKIRIFLNKYTHSLNEKVIYNCAIKVMLKIKQKNFISNDYDFYKFKDDIKNEILKEFNVK